MFPLWMNLVHAFVRVWLPFLNVLVFLFCLSCGFLFFSIELDSVCACVYELVSHVFHDISFSFSYSHRIHEFGRCVCLGSIIGPFPACVLCVCLMVIFLPPSFTPRERFSMDEKRIFLKFQKFACILISYMLPFNDTHTLVSLSPVTHGGLISSPGT